ETHHLGDPLVHHQAVMQAVVPAGCWFAAGPASPQDYALVRCAVAPGLEFSRFELATENDLEPAARQHGDWLRRLLHPAMPRPAWMPSDGRQTHWLGGAAGPRLPRGASLAPGSLPAQNCINACWSALSESARASSALAGHSGVSTC